MNIGSIDAFQTILLGLRARLIQARELHLDDALEELKTTFTLLRETSYDTNNGPLITVIVAMEDSARDSLLRVDWKSTIPTEEEIRQALRGGRSASEATT